MLNFYLYENYPTNRVTIHASDCGFCNEGKGKTGESVTPNGKWHGPFADVFTAKAVSEQLRRPIAIHQCCGIRQESGTSHGYVRFSLDDVQESELSLEKLFERRLLELYVDLRDATGYSAKRFLTSVRKNGGVEHAKRALRRPANLQEGFQRLKQAGMLNNSMEAHICSHEFSSLFTDWEIREAKQRLSLAG